MKALLAFGSLLACVSSRPVQRLCLESMEMFGYTDNWWDIADIGRMEGDLNTIANMSLMKLAYSRPYELMVCADDQYVHGIQLNIKMYPYDNDDEENELADLE